MEGPMLTCTSAKVSWTAWAMTWAMLWRRIDSPSGEAASIGSTAASPVREMAQVDRHAIHLRRNRGTQVSARSRPASTSFTVVPAG